ncbi:hypothetical protein CR162_06900 [Pseudoroseomonas rhizosphaerae]|uniref:Uncharacterized protein n=1 Tax=Teichococcus rhizosphaerae TaxID=1335062 RepID=A0A2C7A654_9PROT|nr:hypothetical protein CR162_06900 [Pseudoroseomonas rhizosphaerae]
MAGHRAARSWPGAAARGPGPGSRRARHHARHHARRHARCGGSSGGPRGGAGRHSRHAAQRRGPRRLRHPA